MVVVWGNLWQINQSGNKVFQPEHNNCSYNCVGIVQHIIYCINGLPLATFEKRKIFISLKSDWFTFVSEFRQHQSQSPSTTSSKYLDALHVEVAVHGSPVNISGLTGVLVTLNSFLLPWKYANMKLVLLIKPRKCLTIVPSFLFTLFFYILFFKTFHVCCH